MHLFSFYSLVFKCILPCKDSYDIYFQKLTKKIMIGSPKKEVKLKFSAKWKKSQNSINTDAPF